jgi:hypothetical protein
MTPKHLFVSGITLLYYESLLETKHENSEPLVRKIIAHVQLPEVDLGINSGREVLLALKMTAVWMCNHPVDHEYDDVELLQRLQLDVGEDVQIFDAFKTSITGEFSQNKLKKLVTNLRNTLNNFFRDLAVDEIVSRAAYQLKFKRTEIKNMRDFVAKMVSDLDPYQLDALVKDPAIVSEVNFSNAESLAKAYEAVKEIDAGKGILRTGFQGLNRMLQGGIRQGDCGVIGALQHKYKTGFSLTLFKQIALYNVPYMRDPTKKPLLLRISFEDSTELNMQFLYQSLYENEMRQACSEAHLRSKTPVEIAEYVKARMEATGFEIMLLRVDPTQWTYLHLCNKVVELESDGYEIHLLMVDYLNMLPKTGCSQGTAGEDIRDLFKRMRNFCNPRKIPFITPHQLSSEAKQLIRENRMNFVQEIAEKGYYDGCRRLDQEVDWELYIHIEKVNSVSYLTIQRGKHRFPRIIPDSMKYMVLQFHDVGGLLDDINGPDTTLRKPGGGVIGSGNEVPFFEFNDLEDIPTAAAH